MEVKIKKLSATAKTPTKGSRYAAGYDLYSDVDEKIWPGDTKKIPINIAISIPEGCFGGIYARSGLATKNGLRPANCVGIIDADYRGNIIVSLHNYSNVIQHIIQGDRVAQLIIQPYLSTELCEVDELDNTERGGGGFGSTGRS